MGTRRRLLHPTEGRRISGARRGGGIEIALLAPPFQFRFALRNLRAISVRPQTRRKEGRKEGEAQIGGRGVGVGAARRLGLDGIAVRVVRRRRGS